MGPNEQPPHARYAYLLDRIGVPEELRAQFVDDMRSLVASLLDQVEQGLEEHLDEEPAVPPLAETIEQKLARLSRELGIK